MRDKFLNLLGICRKAGKLTLGAIKTYELINSGKAEILFVASDLSEKTEKELKFTAKNYNVAVVRTDYSIETLSAAIGAPAGVLSVSDQGFATALKNKLNGGSTQ